MPMAALPAIIGGISAAASVGGTIANAVKKPPEPPAAPILDDGGPQDGGIGMQPPPLDLAPFQGVPSPQPMGGMGGAPLLDAIQAPSM